MSDYTEKKCPECGQQLRFPNHIGGLVMVCPSCGKKFHSDFKLGGIKRAEQPNVIKNVFELPTTIMGKIGRFFSS